MTDHIEGGGVENAGTGKWKSELRHFARHLLHLSWIHYINDVASVRCPNGISVTNMSTALTCGTSGVQVKLWDRLRTRAIPERLTGAIQIHFYLYLYLYIYLQFSAGHVERANSVKLLGINLDADFSWKSYIEATRRLKRAGVRQDQLLHF